MRTAAGLACIALLVACSAVDHPVPKGEVFERDDFRFAAPAGWDVLASTEVSYGPTQRVVYVGTQPLHDDCVVEATGVTCEPPIEGGLRRGGILITWIVQQCVAQGCQLPAAQLLAVGNRQGVRVPSTYGCEDIGYTERSAYYVTVTPQRVDVLAICAREPSSATRSALAGFLDGIQWRIP